MSKKYIEADALIKSLATETGCMDRVFHAMDVADMVKNFHAADVVEVVRCKDCDNWEYIGNLGLKRRGSCAEWSDAEDGMTRYTDENDFCSYGERKDG